MRLLLGLALGAVLVSVAALAPPQLGPEVRMQPLAAPSGDSPAGMAFSAPMLIDGVRAGGEPVIAALPSGVLVVSAHPGWTHVHPDLGHVPLEVLAPASATSYLWRSLDGGATWQHVGLPTQELGPRTTGFGVSDPDLAVTSTGAVVHTDLWAAEASVSWSEDDGATWLPGNPVASQGPIDRQWLAAHGDFVYFTGSYFAGGRAVLRSDDLGMTWERLGNARCGGDFVAAHDGTLYVACNAGVSVSIDGGATFQRRNVPDHGTDDRTFGEPAVDGAGNVWLTWTEGEGSLWLAGSPDRGQSWPWVHDLTPTLRAALGEPEDLAVFWAWASAGSAGRVAVTAYASPTAPPSDAGPADRVWSLATVAAFEAAGAAPELRGYVLAPTVHVGPACQSGTSCQFSSRFTDEGDRRLGDFFETTIDDEGFLHVAYSDTATLPGDWVSHPGYVRQVAGPRFVVDGSHPTQG